MDAITVAALSWYHARRRQTEAAGKLREYRATYGSCDFQEQAYYEGGHYAGGRGPCYATDDAITEWCEACAGGQPLWEARQAASRERGKKLRVLTRLLSKHTTDS